jgi:hypothetical protein
MRSAFSIRQMLPADTLAMQAGTQQVFFHPERRKIAAALRQTRLQRDIPKTRLGQAVPGLIWGC